jgi:surfeit locus 1 family protein
VKVRTVLVTLLVLAVAAVCVRLGFWQISRLHEKQALNAALRSALVSTPVVMDARPLPLDRVRGLRVEARGRYDGGRHILLSARSNAGSPGVDVVTPLLFPGDSSAVLVDRGWLYSADAATARPADYPEPGEVTVLGVAESLRRGSGGAPLRLLPPDPTVRISARWLDLDSLAGRFPYALAPYVLRQLPGRGVPGRPLRRAPHAYDENMHLSYAIQWFLFAVILLGGSAALARSRRRREGRETIPREI